LAPETGRVENHIFRRKCAPALKVEAYWPSISGCGELGPYTFFCFLDHFHTPPPCLCRLCLPPPLLPPNSRPKPLVHHPCAPRLPLVWQNASVTPSTVVCDRSASPPTSPLTPLAWELTPLWAKCRIFDQQLARFVLISREGRRFHGKSTATRDEHDNFEDIFGKKCNNTAKIVSPKRNKNRSNRQRGICYRFGRYYSTKMQQ
jgi:hypothetical protein